MDNLTHKRIIFIFVGITILIIDQIIKAIILSQHTNQILQSAVIDIVLVFNKGVAFSFLSFLDEYLKWILLVLLCFMLVVVIKSGDFFERYYIVLGAIIGAGFGNLIDRFIHSGVVDYVYWHFGFKFAVFNFADSIINVSIAFIIIHYIYNKYKKNV